MKILVGLVIVAALIVVAGIWVVYWRSRREGGFFVAQKHFEERRWKRCKNCDGCGVLLMGEIIPKHLRSFITTEQGLRFETQIANTAKCDVCLGMCGHWVDAQGRKLRTLQDRKIGDVWT